MKIKFENVNIVDANKSIKGNVYIEGEKIIKINGEINDDDFLKIDCNEFYLMPSFVDMHTHLRDPGYTYKEDLETGQKAALKGGYTHLLTMANTNPVVDRIETIKYVLEKSRKLKLTNIYQACSVTKGLNGKELVDFYSLSKFTKYFSDDGLNINDNKIMKKALEKSSELDFLILTHCDPETEIVNRDLKLVEEVGGNIHLCHISLKSTLDIIREFKSKIIFSTEVTPHHLFESDIDYKVNPSFGKKVDRNSLIKAIKDGTLDVIATDHAPHSELDKLNGSPGISSIEVAFTMVNKVFYDNNISLNKLSEMMSYNPSKIMKLKNNGLVNEGYYANLVLVDVNHECIIDTSKFISKGKNNPFNGYNVKGKVLMTIRNGEILYDNR